ncbi:hypothetical protein Hanom_Chr08g00744341 [Helianthus anomalus]
MSGSSPVSNGSSHSFFFFVAFGRTVGVHVGKWWRSVCGLRNERLVILEAGSDVGFVRNGGMDLGRREVVAIG